MDYLQQLYPKDVESIIFINCRQLWDPKYHIQISKFQVAQASDSNNTYVWIVIIYF